MLPAANRAGSRFRDSPPMKYSLRSLMILVVVLPPVLAAAYLSLAFAAAKEGQLPGAIGLVFWLFVVSALGVHFVVKHACRPRSPPMFRFSIRELMLVTALVAVCGAWWVDRRFQESEWKNYATCLEKLLIDDGFEILRDKDWVRATRIIPCLRGTGSSATAYVAGSSPP
jgi:hypothetical protein